MAFPATPLPVRNRLFIGGEWIDFSDSTLIRDPINIRRGVPDWGVRPDPSRCGLSLKNQTGDLSPRKPTGQYYGLFGANTALQVVIDEASDDFDRTESNGWGTSTSGHTWATSGGAASAYATSGGNATTVINATNSARITVLDVDLADCDVVMTFAPGVVATGAAIQMSTLLRYQDDNNLYFVTLLFETNSTVTAAIVRRIGGSNTVLATTSALGYYTATSRWRLRAKICGRIITLRAWDADAGTEPSTFDTWAADNTDSAILTPGPIGTRHLLQAGNTNTLNVTVTTSDLEVVHHRFNGEVPSWPVDWDLSGTDVWTSIEAAGILQRINKNGESFSALRRTVKSRRFIDDYAGTSSSRRPVAYWPLEEETGSTVASSGLPGGQPMTITGTVDWASVSTVVGSDPLPDMMTGTATLVGYVPAAENLTGAWTVGAVFSPPTLTSTWTALSWRVNGAAFDRFELRLTTGGNYELHGFNGGSSTSLTSGAFQDLASMPAVVAVRAETSGSDTTYEITSTSQTYTQESSTTPYTAAGSAPGYVTQVTVNSVSGGASDTAAIGHVVVWDGYFPLVFDSPGLDWVSAVSGNAGDQAITRLIRLFERQEEIPFLYVRGSLDGDFAADTERMGPQRSGTLADVVDDALVVDKGLLFEARDENAVVYVARRARYNLPVTLALTYGSSGHVAPGFRPVEDNRDVVNDLTIVREGGASGRYEKTTGRKSVHPPPDGSYRNPRKKTLPLYNDGQPYQHAAWEVNVATWDEARYPSVNVDMARSARDASAVYEQAKRLDIGGRLTVANPPEWLPPDMIDLHALGMAEVIGGGQRVGAYAWRLGAQTVPAGPFSIAVLDSDDLGKLDTAGCELMIDRDSDDTTLTVHTTVQPKWTTSAGEMPIPLIVAGERMSCTAVANVSPAFVAAGAAAHGNNASVSPALPAGLADGDLLLTLAGIRNSGTGFPLPPDDDWETLLDMGNVCLFGKYAQSGESAPNVRFVAGEANADTSAQTAAFRGVGLTVVKRSTQLNSSAQNIGYPALTVPRANSLIIVVGWKQDDWTSVATLAGMTEIGEPDTTTGDDQGLVWDFVLQTTPTNISSGSFTVTGGGNAISRGGVIALGTDVQTMTVTRSVNTVAKSQSARTPINVYQPFRLGL